MKYFLCVLLICISSSSVAKDSNSVDEGLARIQIVATIPPQKYLLERIAGEHAGVISLVGPGVELETYEPTPKQIEQLVSSDIFFPIGFPAEQHWLKLFKGRPIIVHECCEQYLQQSARFSDPHLWNDPINMLNLIDEYTDILSTHTPAQASVFQTNADSLKNELTELHQAIQQCFQVNQKKHFLVDHGSWDYFAQRYGLVQLALEYEGREHGPKAMRQLLQTAKEKRINTLFLQQQTASSMSKVVMKELNAVAAILDPLGNNYIQNIKSTAHKILISLGDSECLQ